MTDLPTVPQIRRARKAELVAWAEAAGLEATGTVDELRARLVRHVESEPAKPTAKPAEAAGPAAKPARPAPAVPPKVPAKPAEKPAPAEPPPTEEGAEGEAETEEEEEVKEEVEEEKPKARKKAKEEKEPEHVPKAKPELPARMRDLLRIRREIASRRPRFLRQEWFTHPRLGMKWRKPTGGQTKLRRHYGYRPNVVSIGYRGPKAVRGLHPSGFREILVHTVRELDGIDPKLEAARIAGSVGGRRRTEIEAAADEKGIRVLNRREEE